MGPNPELETVAALWDKTARERVTQSVAGWLDSPIVIENCVQARLGDPKKHWLIGLTEKARVPRGGRWLSLGCGAAGQEIFASQQGLFESVLALDASPASLEEGRRSAAAQGVSNIEFGGVDLNSAVLPVRAFDVVLMTMSLHHVKNVGPLLSQIRRTLRPGGFLLFNEFVGPRQFQFSDRQLAAVRELLAVLPPAMRKNLHTAETKSEYVRMPVEHWNVADPSEAIRSDRILPEVRRKFRIVEQIDYGGPVLHLLLEFIIHNFRPDDEKDVALVRLLGKLEDALIRSGELQSDFTLVAARRRGIPLAI
jgi:ubiquinone/menaquinone biosynthesis C-methylase UbiE